MADVHTKQIRSYNMSRIRGKDTKPELMVRSFLHVNGFRFKLHDKNLPGKPDIVLPRYKTVIFVHGCFWHGHARCKYFKVPQTRTEWWLDKIKRNKLNDAKGLTILRKEGWKVIVVWECALKPAKTIATLNRILEKITVSRK